MVLILQFYSHYTVYELFVKHFNLITSHFYGRNGVDITLCEVVAVGNIALWHTLLPINMMCRFTNRLQARTN